MGSREMGVPDAVRGLADSVAETGDVAGRGMVRGSGDLWRPSAALGLKGREIEGNVLTSKSAR